MRARTRIYLSIYISKNLHRKVSKALTSCQGFIFTKQKSTTRLRLTDLRTLPQLTFLIRCIKKIYTINTIICIIMHRKEVIKMKKEYIKHIEQKALEERMTFIDILMADPNLMQTTKMDLMKYFKTYLKELERRQHEANYNNY